MHAPSSLIESTLVLWKIYSIVCMDFNSNSCSPSCGGKTSLEKWKELRLTQNGRPCSPVSVSPLS